MTKRDVQTVQNNADIMNEKIGNALDKFVQTMKRAGVHVHIGVTVNIDPQNELDPDPICRLVTFKET